MRKIVNGLSITCSKKLNSFDNIIELYTEKPFNFNLQYVKKETINEYYDIIREKIGYNFKIKRVNQTHSTNIVIIDENNISKTIDDTDGLITNLKGVAIGTSLADCLGIILYDPVKEVIGNIHSGWKGTLGKIIVNGINIMVDKFLCNPKDIIAYLTPSIRECSFEVDSDVKDKFEKEFGLRYITTGEIKDNKQKYFIDTVSINKDLLISLGLKESNIEIEDMCTMCNYDKYYSYRAFTNKLDKVNGRNISIICMKED